MNISPIVPFPFPLLKAAMQAHALSRPDEEVCGLIAAGQYWPCKNVHSQPNRFFAIEAKDYVRVEKEGPIEGVFHSHIDSSSKFSPEDIAACKQGGVPWMMFCLGTSEWTFADPTGDTPYLGRPWIYGIYDCYSLFRDFYRREFGIELADYERGAEFEWASPEWRMFEKNVKDQGFVEVEEPSQKGDMLLMQLQAPFPNHTGVLVNPSRNLFYHHLLDRFSEETVYGGYWAKHTNKVLRHRELL
jgi:proteasome lid subunit RPN8/RPN11